jgi:hypothetical protein
LPLCARALRDAIEEFQAAPLGSAAFARQPPNTILWRDAPTALVARTQRMVMARLAVTELTTRQQEQASLSRS